MSSKIRVSLEELKRLTRESLRALGHHQDDLQRMVELLVFAQLRGNSQGIVKIPSGGMNPQKDAGEVEVEHETPLSCMLNANRRPGIAGLYRATEEAMSRAKAHGFGLVSWSVCFLERGMDSDWNLIVLKRAGKGGLDVEGRGGEEDRGGSGGTLKSKAAGLHGVCTGTGAIGFYAEKMAKEGLVGFVFTQSPELVAPYGCYEPIFGTNPMAVGMPRRAPLDPIVLDTAMSAIAFFRVHEAKWRGEALPEGAAFDAEGNETTAPEAALKGALRVFDRGYKGSHLALMVEVLGGVLGGGAVKEKKATRDWGSTVFCFRIDLLGKEGEYYDKVEDLVERLKSAKRTEGAPEPLLPGERGNRESAAALSAGAVELDAPLVEKLRELAEKGERGEIVTTAAAL
uniref:Malate dehydrogenase n=1 Tax=Chromera velia CCMP2878 TaxID=1169474 RepID=A0A0G4F8X2_9ALVE|eukprot:Cvel_2977.t1-p1 / transcript=Cvel_2977.t1 / gene=Cvel_2977 / organism=Chromera_velia_CCMP2878 / gene_product=Malate/(S)-sulfolactate dehydrogenase, putative / transcript_product=Malate/(S)-sulfolactate dehydrogenase, putative / location=Cvel_scaffold118:56641-61279(+) / protein_length=398 / sequence_SO=supercontig / SO=protein_coding / is_pseudo=false